MKPISYPRKRYVYRCKCGKRPLRGSICTNQTAERAVFDAIDEAWAQSHNQPGCTIASKIVEVVKPK